MDVDDAEKDRGAVMLASHRHRGGDDRWRERTESNSEDEVPDPEDEAVRDLLTPTQPTEIDVDEGHPVPEPSNAEVDDETDEEDVIVARKGEVTVWISLT